MSLSIAASPDIAVPLELNIQQEGVGGVTGEAPTVRLRDGTTTNSYLDFFDNTFKTAAWTAQDQALTEVGSGQYTYSLDLSAIVGIDIGNIFIAEFRLAGTPPLVGGAHDILVVGLTTLKALTTDIELIRKSITNRMEEFPGDPGTLILWDDDGVTPLLTWSVRDAAGNGVVATVGCPAKRTAAV